MFKPEKLVKITCIFPQKYLSDVTLKLQDIGLVHLTKAQLTDGFKPVKSFDKEYKNLSGLLVRISYLINLIKSRTFKSFFREFFGPRYVYAAPRAGLDKKKISKDLERLEKKYGILKYSKAKINWSDYKHIILYRDIVDDMLERHRVLQLFSKSKYLMRFDGWVEHDKVNRVKNAVEFATNKAAVFTTNKPKADEMPTLVKNPSVVKPFEILTETYGVPSQKEIDPTPIIAVTFTLIFGLMFADVGYGLSLFVLSLFVYLYTTKESRFRRNLNLVLIYLGLVSAIFGFIFGECFGVHFRKGVVDPIRDVILFLKISIIIGLVHLSIGLLAKIFTSFHDRKKVLQGISLLVVMWAAFSLYFKQTILNKALLVIGVLVLLAVEKLKMLEEISSLLAATLSYMRIAALGLGHIIISRLLVSSYAQLSGNPVQIAFFIAIFATGALILLTLGVFVTIIQDTRLHWVEFLPKFMVGKGTKFKPFKHMYSV
ncbi:hypothetical protein HYX02_02745 [Candidatus Woesearchaeota archaeon]|nr:hypothetical protein [Candidatus Woesearchaeota archaeon]